MAGSLRGGAQRVQWQETALWIEEEYSYTEVCPGKGVIIQRACDAQVPSEKSFDRLNTGLSSLVGVGVTH